MGYENRVEFSVLLGKTLTKIIGDMSSEELQFVTSDGETFKMFHESDCCESVQIEDITGDLGDLIGSPITLAEESTSSEDPEDYKSESNYRDSFTWTFYRLATRKGHVDIRWLGESNGYYSESVDFEKVS